MHLWSTQTKPKLETYYNIYLKQLKYILGFNKEANLLASDLATSSNRKC